MLHWKGSTIVSQQFDYGHGLTRVVAAQTLNSTPLVFVVYSTSHRFWKSLLHVVRPCTFPLFDPCTCACEGA